MKHNPELRASVARYRTKLVVIRGDCGCKLATCGRDTDGEVVLVRRDVRLVVTAYTDGPGPRERDRFKDNSVSPLRAYADLPLPRIVAACKHHPDAALQASEIMAWVTAAARGGPRQVLVTVDWRDRLWRVDTSQPTVVAGSTRED